MHLLLEYCGLSHPSTADADRAAAELGMTRNSFYRLLRAWRSSRDPSEIVAVGGPRRSSGRRLHPGDDFAMEVLRKRPPGTTVGRDVAAIEEAARQRNVAIRSTSSLTAMVRELRADGHARHFFIDHVGLAIPVEGPTGAIMPVATVLGSGRSNRILAVSLRIEAASPTSVAVALRHAHRTGTLVEGPPGRRMPIVVDADFSNEWRTLFEVMDVHGLDRIGEDRRIQHGGLVGRDLLVPRLLGIATRPKTIARPPEGRSISFNAKHDTVLSLELAQALIDDRVAAASAGKRRLPLSADVDAMLVDLARAGLL